MKYSNIAIVGSIAYDEIMDYPTTFLSQLNPDKLHQINISFVVDSLKRRLGGTATNIGYNVSLVSERKAKILGGLGKDSAEFMEFYKRNNIDTAGILIDDNQYTGKGVAITDVKDNQIWGFCYGACQKGKDIDFVKFLAPDSLLILSATHPDAFLSAQSYAMEHHIDYCFDFGMTMSWIKDNDLSVGTEHATFIIGNDYEVAQLEKRLGKAVAQLVEQGKSVIITYGEKGSEYRSKNSQLRVKSYRVEDVVDPTGAGDALRGGFFAGLLDGKSIEESLKQGNALASFAIEKIGCVYHKPSKEEIKSRIALLSA